MHNAPWKIQYKWIPRNKNTKAHFLCKNPKYRARIINVTYIGDGLYIAQSSKDSNKFYNVDLNHTVCDCRYFTFQKREERKKCKHIIAAEQLSLTLNTLASAK
ncbi:SWIM zinc finger family protein [Clostridium pasteurianum]|uniref:SWIM zinc finger family protein n=1 Tax=Clostridium pasteurianum TaxID=1501 RepID=UPI0009B7BEB2